MAFATGKGLGAAFWGNTSPSPTAAASTAGLVVSATSRLVLVCSSREDSLALRRSKKGASNKTESPAKTKAEGGKGSFFTTGYEVHEQREKLSVDQTEREQLVQ